MITLDRVRDFVSAYKAFYGNLPPVIELQEDEYETLVFDCLPAGMRPTTIYGIPIKIIEMSRMT